MTSTSKSQFYHLQRGPLLFVYGGILVIFFVKKKKTVKEIPKSFSQKKLFTERKFEKCCESKKMHKGHITGRRKIFNQKKSKLKMCHSYRKNSLKVSETPKFFFNFVF